MNGSDYLTRSRDERQAFLRAVLRNPVSATILERVPQLGLGDWYLTAGAIFQTVWNVVSGRDPQAGIKDYDIFYFDDSDLSYEAEDEVIKRVSTLFADINANIEVRIDILLMAKARGFPPSRAGFPASQSRASQWVLHALHRLTPRAPRPSHHGSWWQTEYTTKEEVALHPRG